MDWLWITLGVFAYLMMSFFAGVLIAAAQPRHEPKTGICIVLGLFWPFLFFMLLLWRIVGGSR